MTSVAGKPRDTIYTNTNTNTNGLLFNFSSYRLAWYSFIILLSYMCGMQEGFFIIFLLGILSTECMSHTNLFNTRELCVFSLTYFIGTAFLLTINSIFTPIGMFTFPYEIVDQVFFYAQSKSIAPYLSSISGILEAHSMGIFHDQFLYHLLNGYVTRFVLWASGEYASTMTLKLLNVYIVSIGSVVMYKIFKNFFPSRDAHKYAIVTVLFSAMLFYSQCILRDSFISLFFSLFFLYFIKKSSVINTLLLIFISWTICLLRPLSFLALLIPLTIYLVMYIEKKIGNKAKWAFVICIVTVLIFMQNDLTPELLSNKYNSYYDRGVKNLNASSLLRYAYMLPPVINYIAMWMFGVISPFPFWYMASNAPTTAPYFLAMLPFKTSILFTLIMIVFSFCFIKYKLWTNIEKVIREKFIVLSIFAFGYMVSSSLNYTPRRVMCMYPIIFVMSFIAIRKLSVSQKRVVKYGTLFSYVGLTFVYVLIK